MKIDKAAIEFVDGPVDFFAKPISPFEGAPNEQSGTVQKFRVTTLDTLNQVFGITTWPQAQPQVSSLELITGLEKYERLEAAGRLTIGTAKDGKWLAELRVMKFGEKGRQNLHRASLDDLDYLTGSNFESLFTNYPDVVIGTRAVLDGETNRQATALAIKCNPENYEAIALAFTVTRVLAVMNDFGAEE